MAHLHPTSAKLPVESGCTSHTRNRTLWPKAEPCGTLFEARPVRTVSGDQQASLWNARNARRRVSTPLAAASLPENAAAGSSSKALILLRRHS